MIGPEYQANYDREPVVPVPGGEGCCVAGWRDIGERLDHALRRGAKRAVLTVDCYVGVHDEQVLRALRETLAPSLVIQTADIFRPAEQIEALVEPFLGGDDPLFGFLCGLELEEFFDAEKVAAAREQVRQASGRVLIVGVGAATVDRGDVLVYADMPRWEGQNRQRRNEVNNLGVENRALKASLQYKRSFFVDWRVCDRWKKPLLNAAHFFLDTTSPDNPKLADGEAVRQGLAATTTRPFRVVPFFDPGPWGGQWMKRVCGLDGYRDPEPENYAWCFDCVPEENSLMLRFGELQFELPSVNLVYLHPRELLGAPVHGRFGDDFPIRFDFLDTMGGGNLSFQVHPLTEFIQQAFGMRYTQDESYYLLDAAPDGACYLGLKPGVDPGDMIRDLEAAQQGGEAFDVDKYANKFPARRHDHFLIPAGTVHCSGRNTMVLEISATPYIFTFKLWDWGRLGLDGTPRPINIDRGKDAIQWDRDTTFCQRELINRIERVAEGPGWAEERTGLHERQFIETRRHWFTDAVPHDTGGVETGGVHVLNLVEGREAVVESPEGAFDPFVVHYAETFIVPAAVGAYTIRPHGEGVGQRCATIKAYVRNGLENHR